MKATGSYVSALQTLGGVSIQQVGIYNFGYWAMEDSRTLFNAFIDAEASIRNGVVTSRTYDATVSGTRSGSNPVSGSAVWSGGVRALDTGFTRVTGDARLEFDLDAATIDVRFTGFNGGHADMSWDGLDVTNGSFQDGNTLDGAFYGDNHQGVAGKFTRDRLDGVFGAVRQ